MGERMPTDIDVFLIEGESFEFGAPLSAPVRTALAHVTGLIEAEIHAIASGRETSDGAEGSAATLDVLDRAPKKPSPGARGTELGGAPGAPASDSRWTPHVPLDDPWGGEVRDREAGPEREVRADRAAPPNHQARHDREAIPGCSVLPEWPRRRAPSPSALVSTLIEG
jgi:hypothetical protein